VATLGRKEGLTLALLATRLLEEEHVAVVPGSAFSPTGEAAGADSDVGTPSERAEPRA
jgi:aspartate/methionine/tyrosine aminotransferase